MNNNELMHHGIRGQKWGVRRYQNSDGSLTKAGKKRYLTEENPERVQSAKAEAKSFKNMSNEELQKVTYRMNLENNYLNAKRNLENATTKKEVNKGYKFIKSIGNDVILSAAKNVGRSYLEKILKVKLGLVQEGTSKDIPNKSII